MSGSAMTADDWIIFTPGDVDLSQSPLRNGISEPTFVLAAYNPALTRLGNGNLLLMVRVAEALEEPVRGNHVRRIRWSDSGFVIDQFALDSLDLSDPRAFVVTSEANRPFGRSSFSWLLPVEISADGRDVVKVHYDKAIAPTASHQSLGLEDARVSLIGGSWYMTVSALSPERQCVSLYTSVNGLEYRPLGVILDHQNRDMVLFEGRVGQKFMALTRPLGSQWVAYPPDSEWRAGPAIQFASSPDGQHWKPGDAPGLRIRRSTPLSRIGGGAQPVQTPDGWLVLYNGVEPESGIRRTYWALLDREDPCHILHQADQSPLIEPIPALTEKLAERRFLNATGVFTSGMLDMGDHYLVAAGEAELACRMTRLDKGKFAHA